MRFSTGDILKIINIDVDTAVVLEGEVLEKYKKYLLSMAYDIISVLERENIVYHLGGGTCLGAIRHHGFIPWDDDFDINVLGSEFERFRCVFEKSHGDKYVIHTAETKGFGRTSIKIRLKNSVFRGKEDLGIEDPGFFIDIFRIENTYDNKILRNIHGALCMVFGYLLSCRRLYEKRDILRKLVNSNEEVNKALEMKYRIGRLISFWSLEKWARKTTLVYSMCQDNSSKFVCVPSGNKHFFGTLYKREQLTRTVSAKFEGFDWKVPEDYDYYLTNLYGDYMVIPPDSKHEKHIALELVFPNEAE